MPKPKAFLKYERITKKAQPTLDTADDYQAAGVEFEEAAGKHRAGDPAKSMRFFERAINVYNEGLSRFPTSFDLAYNKARAQYEVATHPKLVKQLQRPLLDILRAALASHEYALKLNEEDADLLFNTSQVLTSVAEELASDGHTTEAIHLLQTASGLLDRCLSVQVLRCAESQEQHRAALKASEIISSFGHQSLSQEVQSENLSGSDDAQWASVVEPVTIETLLDTIAAGFSTMTTLCTTIMISSDRSPSKLLADIESQSSQLREKARSLSADDTNSLNEVALADIILQSALLDAAFMLNELPTTTYQQSLDSLWTVNSSHVDLQRSSDSLLAKANALIAFNTSLSNADADSNLRWNALTSAMKSLVTAARLPDLSAEARSKTHFLRGDISLLQYRMSRPPALHKEAASNAETLLKNAEVFYRNSSRLSMDQEGKERAIFRSTVTQQVRESGNAELSATAFKTIFQTDQEQQIEEGFQDMLDEGLILEKLQAEGLVVYYF